MNRVIAKEAMNDSGPDSVLSLLVLGINQRRMARLLKPLRFDSRTSPFWHEVDELEDAGIVPTANVHTPSFWFGVQVQINNFVNESINKGYWINPPSDGVQFQLTDSISQFFFPVDDPDMRTRAFTGIGQERTTPANLIDGGTLTQLTDIIGNWLLLDALRKLRVLKWLRLLGGGGFDTITDPAQSYKDASKSSNRWNDQCASERSLVNNFTVRENPPAASIGFSNRYAASVRAYATPGGKAYFQFYHDFNEVTSEYAHVDKLDGSARRLHYVIDFQSDSAPYSYAPLGAVAPSSPGPKTIEIDEDSVTLQSARQGYVYNESPLDAYGLDCETLDPAPGQTGLGVYKSMTCAHWIIVEGRWADLDIDIDS